MQEQRTAGQGAIEGKKSIISDEGVNNPRRNVYVRNGGRNMEGAYAFGPYTQY